MSRLTRANAQTSIRILHNPYQQAFLQARRQRLADGTRAFQRLALIAGRRGGKTFVGGISAVEESAVPRTVGWCVAPTYGDLHDYVIPAVLRIMPREAIEDWSEQHFELKLKNGSLIQFRSGEDPERMRGPSLDWAWLDECRKMRQVVWDTLRPALADKRGVSWFTTSPNGFDWLYHTVYKRAQPGPHQTRGYWAVRYKTIDNPAIPKEEVDEARATMDPLWFKQEFEAEFVSFEGAIYGDKIEQAILHNDNEVRAVLPSWPDPDPRHPLVVGMDPGADHPFAAVALVAAPQGLVCIKEYSKRMASVAEHAVAVRSLGVGYADIRYGIDRSAAQVQIELAQHGISASAAENQVWAGIQRILSWLKIGRLKIVESACPLLVQQLRSYRWKDTSNKATGEKGRETPFKLDDDLCDALRYAVMTWPELPMEPVLVAGRTADQVPDDARWAWERERRLSRDPSELEWSPDSVPTGDMFEW
jgi:hypothetical protein